MACFSSDLSVFHTAEDERKKDHLPIRVITHVLPLARKSDIILGRIRFLEDRVRSGNFHKVYKTGGWDDHNIQPAREAILDYYKVCTPIVSSIPCLR